MSLATLQQRLSAPATVSKVAERANPDIEPDPFSGGNGHSEHPPTLREEEGPAPKREPPMIQEGRGKITYLPDIHRRLPVSPDAEQGLLSCILHSTDRVDQVMRLCVRKNVTTDLFHVPAHAQIYSVLEDMWREGGIGIDIITVTTDLRQRGQLDQAGGAAFVSQLAFEAVSPELAEAYIDILQRLATKRRLIADLSEIAGRAYEDVEDVEQLLVEAETRLKKITQDAGPQKTKLPPFEDVSLFLGDSLPALPTELIEGLLHRASKIIVGGTSKGRKTWTLMDMAVSMATGSDFWGFRCQQGKVAYINFEIQRAFALRRIQQICAAKGVQLPKGMLMMINLRGLVAGIEKMSDDLITMMRDGNISAIIVDPIYKALGNRDENKAGDVASLCNELERIAVETGAAIAWGAHYSKGNQGSKESIDRIGGSGVWARDPDSILTMTAHDNEDSFTVDMTLRNFKPSQPYVVKWEWPLFTRDEDADPEALKQPKKPGERGPGAAVRNAEEILTFLGNGPLPYASWQKLARTEDGVQTKAFEKYVLMLKKEGRIIKTPDGWMIRAQDEPRRTG